jgi:hypothetical protein
MLEIPQSKAAEMIGKTVLIGISYCDSSGRTTADVQHFGTVLRVNASEGLVISSAVDGLEISLPPDLEQYSPADPGQYKLKSVNYTAVNPDYISTWSVHPPATEVSGAP